MIFDLRKENEKTSKIKIENLFEYLEKIKFEINNQKILPNYMIYLLFDFLENIYRSKFKEEFLENEECTFTESLFSRMELDQEPRDELREILKRSENYLKKISLNK